MAYSVSFTDTGTGVAFTSSLTGIAFDGTALWICDYGAGKLVKVNPVTHATITTVAINAPLAVCFDGTNIWVTSRDNTDNAFLNRISITLNTVLNTYAYGVAGVSAGSFGICAGAGRIWVANQNDGNVYVFTAVTGALLTTIAIPVIAPATFMFPNCICYNGTNIWVGFGSNNTSVSGVTKITEATQAFVASYPTQGPSGICWDGANIWVCTNGPALGYIPSLQKVNPVTGVVIATYALGVNGTDLFQDIIFANSNLWVSSVFNPSAYGALFIVKLTGIVQQKIVYPVALKQGPLKMAAVGPDIWATDEGSGLGPLWSELSHTSFAPDTLPLMQYPPFDLPYKLCSPVKKKGNLL